MLPREKSRGTICDDSPANEVLRRRVDLLFSHVLVCTNKNTPKTSENRLFVIRFTVLRIEKSKNEARQSAQYFLHHFAFFTAKTARN
jgi:hypothetical protein